MERKYIRIFVFLLLLIVSFSCEKNEPIVEEEEVYSIHYNVFFSLPDNQHTKLPDAGATLFIYNGYVSAELAGYNIDKNGVLTKRESVIYPDEIVLTNENGYAEIYPEYPEEAITILIRSNYYKELVTNSSYLAIKSPTYSQSQFYNTIIFSK